MSEEIKSESNKDTFDPEDFEVSSLEDEIRVDELCQRFLKLFYLDLVEHKHLEPEDASQHAYGADYFLREFVIPDRRENLFRMKPGRVRQFAGNWYIIKTLEPNMEELEGILQGVKAFYTWCHEGGNVSAALLADVERACSDLAYYERRIESFWAIEGDGYLAWEQECSLKD